MASDFVFTSESVTEGHPDKVADQISDAVLDAILTQHPTARVACETLVTTGLTVVAGEITTTCYVDIPHIVRETVREIGYTDAQIGFDADNSAVISAIGKQSGDISRGVTENKKEKKEQGAGDQGMMFGYACTDTKDLMPLPISLAHDLCKRLSVVRKKNVLDYLRPDGKSQVSVRYVDGKPQYVTAVVVSTQHTPEYSSDKGQAKLRKDLIETVINPTLKGWIDPKNPPEIYTNPTGRFETGGPHGDCGLTGRKIIVDTYGGWAPHGGGAFSGKDPSKVDRSACYMARYIAKNIVAAGLAEKCMVQLAYAIGVAEPVSVYVTTYGTGLLDEEKLSKLVRKHFDLTPKGIIASLDLLKPIYRQTAAYGHFGSNTRSKSWEQADKAAALAEAAGVKAKPRKK